MFPFPLWAGSEMDPSRREREADLSRSQTHVSLLGQKAAGDLAGKDTSLCSSSRPRGRAAPLLFLHSLGRHLGLGGGCLPACWGVSGTACWGVSGAGRRLLGAGLWALIALVLFRLRQFTSGAQRRLLPGWSTSVSVSIRTSSRGTTSGAQSSCTWSGGTLRYFRSVSWEGAPALPAAPLSLPSDLAVSQRQQSPHRSSQAFVRDPG